MGTDAGSRWTRVLGLYIGAARQDRRGCARFKADRKSKLERSGLCLPSFGFQFARPRLCLSAKRCNCAHEGLVENVGTSRLLGREILGSGIDGPVPAGARGGGAI